MESGFVGALIGIGFLTLLNVGVIAFSYGRMNQKLTDLCDRVARLEVSYNGWPAKH